MISLCLTLLLSAATVDAAPPDLAFEAYRAQIAAAEKSLRLDETREARRWLEACPEPLRGWEWAHLRAQMDTSKRAVQTDDQPIRIAMSPRGDMVAAVEGSRVILRSWPGLDVVLAIDGHADAVYRAAFSADGSRLVTVSRDVTSRTWDVGTGDEIAGIDMANAAFGAATFSPDGTRAATCAWERVDGEVHGVVWLWDALTGDVLHRRRVGTKPLSAMEFTADGQRLVVGSWDGLVHVLNGADATELARLRLPDEGIYNAVNDIAISPDDATVAVGSKDRTIRVFNLQDGSLRATLRGHGGWVESVSFSPTGDRLASSSIDMTIAVWDTATWTRTSIRRGAGDTVRGVAWSVDGDDLVGCCLDRFLRVWRDRESSGSNLLISVDAAGTYSCAFAPDGEAIAVACHDGSMRLLDARDGTELRRWDAHPGSTCHAAEFSADGTRLISCSWDRTARVWDPRDGAAVAVLDAGVGLYNATLSADGAYAATSGGGVRLWRIESAQLITTIEVDGASPARVAISPDNRHVASAWSDGRVRIHDLTSGAERAVLGDGGAAMETVGFTDDGRSVAAGDAAGVIRLFPTSGGAATLTLDTGGRGVNRLEVSGDRLAAATDQLWLIDLRHGDIALGLRPHIDTIWNLSWSRDGSRLAVATTSGAIRILSK